MSDYQRRSTKSNEDYTRMISHSVYVTNFPDSVSSRDLWRNCNAYGTVVDVFIPLKKSQTGKRFAFVRFIKVFNLDRLVKNLCTIWIGRHHLFANKVRFERPHKPFSPPLNNKEAKPVKQPTGFTGSFANAINGGQTFAKSNSFISSSPALVLDDNCILERDYSKFAMGKVKDVKSIPNLLTILHDEGFMNVKLKYMGGLWVMLEFDKVDTKANLLIHTGVNSWFHVIQDVEPDFSSEERIVWVDIEGVPLRALSYETFSRIGKKWGELLNIEDSTMTSFGRKRVCILTKSPVSIFESFKIIVRGKVFMIRAKELFIWCPNFLAVKEDVCLSDDDSVQGEKHHDKNSFISEDEEGEFNASEVEGAAETIFDDNYSSIKVNSNNSGQKHLTDPFGLYDLLLKKNTDAENCTASPSLSHPPGYTPVESQKISAQDKGEINGDLVKVTSPLAGDLIPNSPQVVQEDHLNGSFGQSVGTNGGSVLGVLEEIIRVGQAMGYSMDGCEKDVEAIIGKQGDEMVFR